MSKIDHEKKTIAAMIEIYCKGNHDSDNLCDSCSELLEYSNQRLDCCKFGEGKPKCSSCEVHCYKPEMREKIRKVMKYSGPRMMLKHPVMAVKHLLK